MLTTLRSLCMYCYNTIMTYYNITGVWLHYNTVQQANTTYKVIPG